MANPQGSGPVRLAVVDADRAFVQVLTKRLEALDWQTRFFTVAPRFDDLVAGRLSALVLDLEALGHAGWSYLEEVCRRLPDLPIIVCSGPSSVGQRVRGLRLGADDWLNKPCHPEELIARVEAAVRRGSRVAAPSVVEPIAAGSLSIRPDQFQAFVGETSVDLTRREFELLHLLAEAQGRVMPREEIYQRVWGYAMAHGDRSVDVFVRKLRQKLEKRSPDCRYIHTHFGVGYRFAPETVGAGGSEEGGAADEDVAPAATPPESSPAGFLAGQFA